MKRNLNKTDLIILKKERKFDRRLKKREERLRLLNKRSLMNSMVSIFLKNIPQN